MKSFNLISLALVLGYSLEAQTPPTKEAQAQTKDFSIDELMELMNTPIVAASKREQRLIDSPQAMEVLAGDAIRQQGFFRLQDALKLMTSVDMVELDNFQSYVGLRGVLQHGLPRTTQILVDGVPIYNSEFSTIDVDNLPVPVDLIDKVEVVRGPSSTLYGSNAVAGVISIATMRPEVGTFGSVRGATASDATKRWSGEFRNGGEAFGVVGGLSGASRGKVTNDPFLSLDGQLPPGTLKDADASHQFQALLRPTYKWKDGSAWLSLGRASKAVATVHQQGAFP